MFIPIFSYFKGWGRTPAVPGGICEPSGSDPGQYEGTIPHTGRSPQASHSFCPGSGTGLFSVWDEKKYNWFNVLGGILRQWSQSDAGTVQRSLGVNINIFRNWNDKESEKLVKSFYRETISLKNMSVEEKNGHSENNIQVVYLGLGQSASLIQYLSFVISEWFWFGGIEIFQHGFPSKYWGSLSRKLNFWCFHIVIHYSHSLLVCKTVFLRLKVIFIHERPKLLSFVWTKDNISNVIGCLCTLSILTQVILSFKSRFLFVDFIIKTIPQPPNNIPTKHRP